SDIMKIHADLDAPERIRRVGIHFSDTWKNQRIELDRHGSSSLFDALRLPPLMVCGAFWADSTTTSTDRRRAGADERFTLPANRRFGSLPRTPQKFPLDKAYLPSTERWSTSGQSQGAARHRSALLRYVQGGHRRPALIGAPGCSGGNL